MKSAVVPGKILIVDDDLNFLNLLKEDLEEKGFIVSALPQANLISEYVENFNPNLILLDIKLENIDGRLICNDLKSSLVTGHIPIIMITGLSYNEISEIDCDADAIIGKPFSIDNLVRTIEDLLQNG
ncbi:two-component system response regulator [Pedobacter aquatilis]|uniref:response regulator n=1 Tax=Pedobacter aquatilis TaxID=351343 RepID=UPI00292FE2A0|nr:response regulator [Pedobacter aquatilis]